MILIEFVAQSDEIKDFFCGFSLKKYYQLIISESSRFKATKVNVFELIFETFVVRGNFSPRQYFFPSKQRSRDDS